MSVIVECEHIVKSYGDLIAVNDVSFKVEEGEIFRQGGAKPVSIGIGL